MWSWLTRWLFPTRPPEKVLVQASVIEDIIALAKSAAPTEFLAFLNGRVEERDGTWVAIINGLNIIPYDASTESTHFDLLDLPTVHGSIGTVHSHPDEENLWSEEDLELFSEFGWVHAIIGAPYTRASTRFYDKAGCDLKWQETPKCL